MPTNTDLATRITHAYDRLKSARQDGCADKIMFWRAQVDAALDELLARRT